MGWVADSDLQSTITLGIFRALTVTEAKLTDIAYYMIFPDVFCVAEVGFAIIISSSAIIRPVFDRIFHGIRSMSKTGGDSAEVSGTHQTGGRIAPSILDRRWSEYVANTDLEIQDMD
jgi:hypothetical protein